MFCNSDIGQLIILTGHETSSSTAMFAAYELALNPDMQSRLRNEITEVLSRYAGAITYDGIIEMKYLDMVFNETLRKYPIVDIQFRRCVKDFAIPKSDLVIPKGVQVMIPVHALHNDERFFDNPNRFDPERFSAENAKKIIPFSYIPFGEFLFCFNFCSYQSHY